MSEAAKITDAAGVVKFEAEMAKGKEHFDAIFSANGTFESKGEFSSEEDEDWKLIDSALRMNSRLNL